MPSEIPNVYHLLWSGKSFPDIYGAAIDSILNVDESARVVVHCFGDLPQSGTFDRAVFDPRADVRVTDPEAVFAQLPAHLRRVADTYRSLPMTATSARSNILRYAILYLHGGIYVDFDTITLQPLVDLAKGDCFIGTERVWALDEPRVAGNWKVSVSPAGLGWLAIWCAKRLDSRIFRGRLRLAAATAPVNRRFTVVQPNNAVIGCTQGAEFLDRVLRAVHNADPIVRYATGPTLVARVARTSPHLVTTLPVDVCYQVEPAESFRYFEDCTLRVRTEAAIIHYVGSNSSRYLRHGHRLRRSVMSSTLAWVKAGTLRRHRSIAATAATSQQSDLGVSL